MTRKTVPYKGEKYHYYYCPTTKKRGCSDGANLKETDLVECVLESIKAHVANIASLESILASGDGQRMADAGMINLSAYLRKMAITGQHINLDLTDVREMVRLLRNVSNNVNQIARRANETRNIYAADVEDLRQHYDTLWGAANKILAGLAKLIK